MSAPLRDLETDNGRLPLMAQLAAERAGLLAQLLGLDEQALTVAPVIDNWTVKDLLAHIAAWDRWEMREMKRVVEGEAPNLVDLKNLDAVNASIAAEWRHRPLAEVVRELGEARTAWIGWLRSLPEEGFFRSRSFEGEDWSFPACVEVQRRHDAEHGAQIANWRPASSVRYGIGPRQVLVAALDAAREELVAAASLVPAQERATRPVCGDRSGPVEPWTLKDLLGHAADWEWVAVEGLRQLAAGRESDAGKVKDIEEWNQAHWRARRDQPWETVWADFQAARRALREALGGMNPAELARPFPAAWDPEGTPYSWGCVYVNHDREHAQDLRGAQTE